MANRDAETQQAYDNEYRAWREAELQRCDADYAEFCLERRADEKASKDFHTEFADWRRRRQRRHGGDTGAREARVEPLSATSSSAPTHNTME